MSLYVYHNIFFQRNSQLYFKYYKRTKSMSSYENMQWQWCDEAINCAPLFESNWQDSIYEWRHWWTVRKICSESDNALFSIIILRAQQNVAVQFWFWKHNCARNECCAGQIKRLNEAHLPVVIYSSFSANPPSRLTSIAQQNTHVTYLSDEAHKLIHTCIHLTGSHTL